MNTLTKNIVKYIFTMGLALFCILSVHVGKSMADQSVTYTDFGGTSPAISNGYGGYWEATYGNLNLPSGSAIDYMNYTVTVTSQVWKSWSSSTPATITVSPDGQAQDYVWSPSANSFIYINSPYYFNGPTWSIPAAVPPWYTTSVKKTDPTTGNLRTQPYTNLNISQTFNNVNPGNITTFGLVTGFINPSGQNGSCSTQTNLTVYYIVPPTLQITGQYYNAVDLSWNDVGGNEVYDIYKNGSFLTQVSNTTTYTVNNLTPGQTYSFYVTAETSTGNWTGASNTVSASLIAGPYLQYNGSQQYWNQEIVIGTQANPSMDYHVLVTEMDAWGNTTSTTKEYDIGDAISYSIPMQAGKYYEVQVREVSPSSTGWTSAIDVWNAPQLTNWQTGIVKVSTNSITINIPQVMPSQQFYLEWKTNGSTTWNRSGPFSTSYTLTGLQFNTEYNLAVDPVETASGATDWWASLGSVWTDSTPTATVVIDNGAKGTNVASADLTITGNSLDSPIIAVGVSNDNNSYTWYPVPSLSQGLSGAYYDNPGSTAYGQVITDEFYNSEEVDGQVDITGWPTGVPSSIQSADSGNVNWGAVWQGYIWIDTAGSYNFAIPSDDGAYLTINGQALVSDWASQGQPLSGGQPTGETATISFSSPGWYPIQIQYFQGNGANGIQLMWEAPGQGSYSIVSSSNLTPVAISSSTQAGDTVNFDQSWGLTGNGAVTVYVKVMTADGTISAPATDNINFLPGAQNPVCHLELDSGAQTTSTTTVDYVLTVSGAGLPDQGQMQYEINGGGFNSWQPLVTTGTLTIGSTAGLDTVTYNIQDANGLISQASAQIIYQPPIQDTGVTTQNSGTGTTGTQGTYDGQTVYFENGQDVSIDLSGLNDPAYIKWSTDDINWSNFEQYTSPLDVTLPKGQGLSYVYVEGFDSSQNLTGQIKQGFVTITEPPSIEISTENGADAASAGSDITILVNANDSVLPISDLSYSVNGGAFTPLPSNEVISVPVSSGVNDIVVTVEDPAGNKASASITVWGL